MAAPTNTPDKLHTICDVARRNTEMPTELEGHEPVMKALKWMEHQGAAFTRPLCCGTSHVDLTRTVFGYRDVDIRVPAAVAVELHSVLSAYNQTFQKDPYMWVYTCLEIATTFIANATQKLRECRDDQTYATDTARAAAAHASRLNVNAFTFTPTDLQRLEATSVMIRRLCKKCGTTAKAEVEPHPALKLMFACSEIDVAMKCIDFAVVVATCYHTPGLHVAGDTREDGLLFLHCTNPKAKTADLVPHFLLSEYDCYRILGAGHARSVKPLTSAMAVTRTVFEFKRGMPLQSAAESARGLQDFVQWGARAAVDRAKPVLAVAVQAGVETFQVVHDSSTDRQQFMHASLVSILNGNASMSRAVTTMHMSDVFYTAIAMVLGDITPTHLMSRASYFEYMMVPRHDELSRCPRRVSGVPPALVVTRTKRRPVEVSSSGVYRSRKRPAKRSRSVS